MDIIQKILAFNAGRDPERLALKYQNMRSDPFVFLRASCHLFYDRLPGGKLFSSAPPAWLCGDLHLENFGSYKGENRLVYFDLNDFDEAILAPVTWESVRFLASLLVGAKGLKVTYPEALALCNVFLDAYAGALAAGSARWVERDTATGLVAQLLKSVQARSRPDFLNRRTELAGKKRRIRIDGKKALPATDKQKMKVIEFMREFAEKQSNPGFFKVLDVARRIAGNGSLGVDRYILLIAGKQSPDANYLLDLKAAQSSSLAPHVRIKQPRWKDEAHRVVGVQQRVQGVPIAFLQAIRMGKRSYVLRGLQPSEDRVVLANRAKGLRRLEEIVTAMGQLSAWGQLRSGGRDGSAIADELIDFGMHANWRADLLATAEDCAEMAWKDWKTFSEAFDDGAFSV